MSGISEVYDLTTIDTIRELQELVHDDRLKDEDPQLLTAVAETLDEHKIESYLIPSGTPGEEGGEPGASPKQIEFYNTFFEHKYRIYSADGANQSGKTVAVGAAFCTWLRDYANDGDTFWVMARTTQTLRDIPCKTLWDMLPRAMFPHGLVYNPKTGFGQTNTIVLNLPEERGTVELWLWSEDMSLDVVESARLNGIWWTECRRESIFDALLPRLAKHQGWVLMDCVPREAWHRMRIKIPAEEGSKDIYHIRFAMQDNAHNLPVGEIKFQRSTMSDEDAMVRIEGKDGSAFGVVYPQYDSGKHRVKPFDIGKQIGLVIKTWEPGVIRARYRCYDYGFRAPSTCLWCELLPVGTPIPKEAGGIWAGRETEREVLAVYREWYAPGFTIPRQSRVLKEMSKGEYYRFSGRMIVDSSIYRRDQTVGEKVPSIAAQLEAHGVKCKKGRKATNLDDHHAMVAKVRLWFENDKIMIFDTCPNTSREHQVWSYKETRDGDPYGNEPFQTGNDHTCDALKYLMAENLTFNKPDLGVYNAAEGD